MKNQTEGKYIMKNRQIKNGKWMKAFSMLLAVQLVFTTAGAPVYATGIETETVAETETETETAAETQVETEIESEAAKENETETESETVKETKAETEMETASEARTETEFAVETAEETVKENETESETVKETKKKTKKNTKKNTQMEPETLKEAETETQTELETAAAEIAQAEPLTVSISSTEITPDTTSITVNLSSVPSMGILRVVQLDAEDVYESSKLNSYKSLHFSIAGSLKAGENTLALTASAEVGKKVLVVLRDSSGSSIVDAVSEPVMATAVSQGGGEEPGNTKTPQEILANCAVTLMKDGAERTETFTQDETSVDVQVKLDDSLEDCYMRIIGYAGNTGFDPDSPYNKVLWNGRVKDGELVTCDFNQSLLPLPVGYDVIANLNVKVGEDYYLPCSSQSLEVVDESGEGFQDYVYPDAVIDEKELEEGATSLHISLTGDERLFQAAKEGKTEISISVAQYPDGDKFDFESENQIPLLQYRDVEEAFSGMEVSFPNTPLKEGYRVRAVVYWGQNAEIYLPKGNDYEEMFHMTDDSVLVTGAPKVESDGEVKTTDTAWNLNIRGTIPEGAMILVKQYPGETTSFVTTGGTFAGSAFDVTKGSLTLNFTGTLEAGNKLAAFLLKDGEVLASTGPVTVVGVPDFTVAAKNVITTESTEADFEVTANDTSITKILLAALCRVDENGKADAADSNSYVARLFQQTPGTLTFQIPENANLKAGEKLRLVLKYNNGNSVFEGEDVMVQAPQAENSIVIQEKEVYTDTETFTVTVSGYEEMVNGYLFLSTGLPSTDGWGDSRTRLGSKRFTGAGTYTFQVSAGSLKKGNTIQAYLYKYDIDNDSTRYEYSESVAIAERNPVAKESTIEMVTDAIRADRTDVWIKADFADDLTGTVKLYTYEGSSFDAEQAEEIYSGTVKASENSQKVSFGSGKLTAGKKLAAVLYLSDDTSVMAEPKVIQAVPEKKAPSVQFTSAKVTPGMTRITAKADFDSSESSADYVVYQFTEETLDKDTAEVLYQGTTTYYGRNSLTIPCRGKLKEGAKLQIVLTAGEKEAVSNVLEVQPAPDWGTPYAAFEVSAVKSSDKTVDVTVDYADEYLSLGEDFYCDVTIYQFSGDYTDKEFEDKEMWERLDGSVTRVAQINSNFGDTTKGTLTLNFKDSAVLTPGNRLIVKLRLPHTEWEGEEVDYLSESIPIVDENETIVPAKVLLYNLGEDISLGARLRSILESLGIQAEDVSNSQLNQKVGYLSGQNGYTENDTPYEGEGSDAQFMLMANFSSAQVDRFLAAMSAQGIRIDHKAVTTAYNADYEFHQLIDDIKDEHEVFQAILELNQLVKDGENLEDGTYGQKEQWAAFQEALKEGNDLLKKEEPSAEELQNASAKLKALYLELTGMKALEGNAVLAITEEEGGTYTITASLEGADAEETYTFTWNSGETGPVLTGVPAEELAGKIVTITGENRYGKTSGQLQVPGVPDVTVNPKKTGLIVNVVPKEAEVNRPKADTIQIRVYENGTLKGEKTLQTDGVFVQAADASQKLSAEFKGLTADTGYTVKVYAVSPVGRSDTAVTPARTLKEETDESETKPSESEKDESETKPSESETDESESKASESETGESETKASESETGESETKAPETEESESQKETEAETETEKQTEVETETETTKQTETETETETTKQTETETETETTKQTETESESEKQTEQNASGEQKNDSGKGNASNQKTDAAKNGENAKTADQNNVSMWLLLLAASGSIAAAAFRRKRER